MSKKPTARQKAYHLSLIGKPCACGCGRQSTLVHHPLTEHPKQGTRRNHEYVVPMFWECHNKLHALGHERDARFGLFDIKAADYRADAIEAGLLDAS